jgi:DNA-binding NtrC family response regulator
MLARLFCAQMEETEASLPEPLLLAWEDQSWPGNVRELRNAVARQLALGDLVSLERSSRAPTDGTQAGRSEEGSGILEQIVASGLTFATARQRVIEEFEQRYVERVLTEHGDNITHAAAASGIARRQLQRVKSRIGR